MSESKTTCDHVLIEERERDGCQKCGAFAWPVEAKTTEYQYDEIVAYVRKENKCTTSMVSRFIGGNYVHAASIVTQMVRDGIVSEPNAVGKREVLK